LTVLAESDEAGVFLAIAEEGKNIHLVGDCSKVGNLRTVIWQAWDVAMKL